MSEESKTGDERWKGNDASHVDYGSKTVMIRAERGDTLEIEGDEYSVVRRDMTYFGPKLTLYREDVERNFLLFSPGPHRQLYLCDSIVDDDGYRRGWKHPQEVTAELTDTKQYRICACGEPLKSTEHRRMAFLGVGEHE